MPPGDMNKKRDNCQWEKKKKTGQKNRPKHIAVRKPTWPCGTGKHTQTHCCQKVYLALWSRKIEPNTLLSESLLGPVVQKNSLIDLLPLGNVCYIPELIKFTFSV